MLQIHSPPSRPKRPRVLHACVACQQKKQKCDGQSPSCRNCLRANRECINLDPDTKRRHPRGYLDSLEQHATSLEHHIAFLESTIQEIQPNVDLDSLTRSSTVQLNRSRTRAERNGEEDISRGPASESPTTDDTAENSTSEMSNLELLCVRSAGGDPHYFGASSGYSFTKMFSATLRTVRAQCPGLTMAGVAFSSAQSQPKPTPAPLPERSVTCALTTAYFEQVHPQFPFLHRPTYLEWEEEVLSAVENGRTVNPVSLYFVYIVAAVGSLTGPLASASLPEGLYASAENLFEQVIQLNALESIQAILCCAMYSIRSPIGVSIWTLSGLALRQCIELGLHRNIPWSKVQSNMLKAQMRRRVFWCCYNLDRAVAITLGRPVGITDADINVEFPLDIDDENITVAGLVGNPRTSKEEPPTTLSAAIHTIRLRHIWAQMQGVMHPQFGLDTGMDISSMLVTSFKSNLKDWLESAPAQLGSNKVHDNAFGSPEWFQLMYHHSILLLHRQSLVSRAQSDPVDATLCSTYLECAQAAESICKIYRHLTLSQRLNDTWGALHVLFLSGVTYLYCLWNSQETRDVYRIDKVSATCTSCMIVLAVMAERSAAVQPYRDAFDMLANATQSMLAEAKTTPAAPAMPILSSSGDEQLSAYLSGMAEFGMCSSVEALLTNMID